MRAVWKFPVEFPNCELEMPQNSWIIHVNSQGEDRVVLWVDVDTEAKRVKRRFVVVGTGHEIPAGGVFVGSVKDSPYMWHLFEVMK